jgi:PKD repeat protein
MSWARSRAEKLCWLFLASLATAGCHQGCQPPNRDRSAVPRQGVRSQVPVARPVPAVPTISSGRIPVAGVISAPEAARAEFPQTPTARAFSFDAEANPESGGAPLRVSFAVTVDDPPPNLSIQWNFGDNSAPASGLSARHVYHEPGQYVAVLMLRGSGVLETRELSIEVTQESFDVEIDADPDIGKAPLATRFTAVLSEEVEGDVDFLWDFGDGTNGDGETVAHTYTGPGEYTAKLTATRTNGQHAASDVIIQVDSPENAQPVTSPDE